MSTADFWTNYQPGFRASTHDPGTPEFFAEVERHRYALEPHIREIARFEGWAGRRVLDIGCGIATDGLQFVRAGADYTGVDQSKTALELARQRFEREGLTAAFREVDATKLPFGDETFDLVWSHGVLHHIDRISDAVAEVHRVLKPGGKAIVMLYHRRSLNYWFTISIVRRILAVTLLIPGVDRLVTGLTRERPSVIQGQKELLRQYGLRYVLDGGLFLSNNTDGPGNPLSRVYSAHEARALFAEAGFEPSSIETQVRYLNARLYPGGQWFEQTPLGETAAKRAGWHLYICAVKSA